MRRRLMVALCCALAAPPAAARTRKQPQQQTLDVWVREKMGRTPEVARPAAAPGSLYSPGSLFSDLARDYRASQVDDLVTVVVSDSASAVSKGTSSASRKSSAKYGISALAGLKPAASAAANLAATSGAMQLEGQGQTTRQNTLSTTVSARVVGVLPNGLLLISGSKNVTINSEHQVVVIRGVVRSADLSPANTIPSDRVADLEVSVQGKGLIGDAVRRPFILYRLLMGLLPL